MSMRSLLASFRAHAGLTHTSLSEVSATQRKVLALQQDVSLVLKDSVKDWGYLTYSYRDDYFDRDVKGKKTLSAFMPTVVQNSRGGYTVLIALKETRYTPGAPTHPHVIRQASAHREAGLPLDGLAEELTDYDFTSPESGDHNAEYRAFNEAARKNLDAAIKAISKNLPGFKVTVTRKSESGNVWAKVFWAKLDAAPLQ